MPNDRPCRLPLVQAGVQVNTRLVLGVAASLLAGAYSTKDNGVAVVPLSLACVVLGVWVTLTVQAAQGTTKTHQQEDSEHDAP